MMTERDERSSSRFDVSTSPIYISERIAEMRWFGVRTSVSANSGSPRSAKQSVGHGGLSKRQAAVVRGHEPVRVNLKAGPFQLAREALE